MTARTEAWKRRLLLPPMRLGRGGARKRYARLVEKGDETEVVFTGMEVVRRDWTRHSRFTAEGGSWNFWCYVRPDPRIDRPGTWRFEGFLDGELEIESELSVPAS